MPWLGDGQWVDTNDEARRIVRGDVSHRPHGGQATKARRRQQERKKARKTKRFEQEQGA